MQYHFFKRFFKITLSGSDWNITKKTTTKTTITITIDTRKHTKKCKPTPGPDRHLEFFENHILCQNYFW